jgi:phosphatidylserine/phosphatidylglycerophosphate/cardiolipin synthase-like enzyme
LSYSPIYWHSWKGQFLKAIIIDGANTWDLLFLKTELLDYQLNTALSELYDLDIIKKENDQYFVKDKRIMNDYLEFYNHQIKTPLKTNLNKSEKVKKLREWLTNLRDYIRSRNAEETIIGSFGEWTIGNKVYFNLESEHIFLNDDMLDRAAKDVIRMSKESVYVVNPFVDSCNTSDILKEKAESSDVRLLTRKPTSGSMQNCHTVLKDSGVNLKTNERVHSKVILVDNLIAVISSMNLYNGSTSGKSKEAGILMWERKNIESIVDFFENRWKDVENE